ncbi:MAG TPA: HEAT repeat domain-containing protein, partial [Pirellulaceae bacterium]|nr:HEAT repeat domain-containing protein [Pirellulaceae bacterium]
ILNLSSGPSGLAYYPGTGLSEHFDGRFFLCDFRGAANGSGVRTFRVREKGAFYEVADEEETLWNILATDVEFGPDGGVYVSDWVNGWTGLNKGRIYRFADPEAAASPIVAEVKQLLSEDLTKKQPADLAKLLAHRDRRVRQAAQFALVDLKQVDALSKVAADLNVGRLGRLHAIWGLGQLASNARTSGAELATKAASIVAPLLDDGDAEVRAQSARVLGDARHAASYDALVKRLDDAHARTRYFASVALGKLGRPSAIGALLKLLADNDNQDPIVRHGAIVALARIGGWKLSTPVDGSADTLTPEQTEAHKLLAATTRHPSAATRLGVTVALRKLRSPLLAE